MSRGSSSMVYDSARARRWLFDDAVELARYRHLLWRIVQRDLTVRYKRSVLGFVWMMLNPLLTMSALAIVFSAVFGFSVEHYVVYLLAGLLLWNFFAQSTTQAIHNLIWNGGLAGKIYIPRSIFVVSAIVVGLVNFILALVPLMVIMLATGHPFTSALLFLPISLVLVTLFALGIGLSVATFAVFFSDVVDVYQVGLTSVMYLTPVFYPESIVPERLAFIIHLNPLYYFIRLFRQPIYDGTVPELSFIAVATALALGAFGIGASLFVSQADEFAYHL